LLLAHHGRKLTIMKLLYTTILACMLAGALTAQNTITLNWIITDENYQPLSGVNVYPKSHSYGSVSDEQGRISLEVRLGEEIIVTHLAFEKLSIILDHKIQQDSIFKLAVEAIILPEILISAENRGHVDIISCPCLFGSCNTVKQSSCWSLMPTKTQNDSKEIESPGYKIGFYPNPTNSFLNLQSEKPLGQVDLYNLNGQKLKIYNFQQQFQAEIDLSGQPKGTYVLRSSQGWVEKVVKL
jgi:hypothetical protein